MSKTATATEKRQEVGSPKGLVAAFLALSLFSSAGETNAQELTITEATRAEWIAVGQVRGRGETGSICTGTLIAPDKVLTAAHCVTHPVTGKIRPFYNINFVAGWHFGANEGASAASNVQLHPAYRSGQNANLGPQHRANFSVDLALITLRDPIRSAAPFPIAPHSFVAGPAAVLGYQNKNQDALIDYLGCQAKTTDAVFLALSCAVKSGTSGGPVFKRAEDGSNSWQMTGVVVAAINNITSPVRGLALRVDQEFLKEVFDWQFAQ